MKSGFSAFSMLMSPFYFLSKYPTSQYIHVSMTKCDISCAVWMFCFFSLGFRRGEKLGNEAMAGFYSWKMSIYENKTWHHNEKEKKIINPFSDICLILNHDLTEQLNLIQRLRSWSHPNWFTCRYEQILFLFVKSSNSGDK